MKALIKVVTGGGSAVASVKYVLSLKGGNAAEKQGDLGARVGKVWVSEDLKGVDLKNPTAEDFDEIADAIEAPTRLWCSRKGRHRDHYVISSPCNSSAALFEAMVPKMLGDLVKVLEINTYLAVIHKDCEHPHVHVICDAYAPGVGVGPRRHLDRDTLHELDSMKWTKAFEAPTPELGAKRSKRGNAISAKKFKGVSEGKVDLCAKVLKALNGKMNDVESMVHFLEGLEDLPFKLAARSKNGKIKQSAVIESNGVKARLDWMIKNEANLFRTRQFEEMLQEIEEEKKKKGRLASDLLEAIDQHLENEKVEDQKAASLSSQREKDQESKTKDEKELVPRLSDLKGRIAKIQESQTKAGKGVTQKAFNLLDLIETHKQSYQEAKRKDEERENEETRKGGGDDPP